MSSGVQVKEVIEVRRRTRQGATLQFTRIEKSQRADANGPSQGFRCR